MLCCCRCRVGKRPKRPFGRAIPGAHHCLSLLCCVVVGSNYVSSLNLICDVMPAEKIPAKPCTCGLTSFLLSPPTTNQQNQIRWLSGSGSLSARLGKREIESMQSKTGWRPAAAGTVPLFCALLSCSPLTMCVCHARAYSLLPLLLLLSLSAEFDLLCRNNTCGEEASLSTYRTLP